MQSSSPKLEACLDLLLTSGADIHFKDSREQTALHHAVKSATPRAVELIVAAGADVHARDKDGFNALHFAAFNLARRGRNLSWGRLVIPTLTRAGCSLQEKDSAGRTPLDYALFTNRNERAVLGAARLSSEIISLLGGSTGPRVAWTSGEGIFV
ncbi:ankyrin repeat-containing domain protein [Triangularia verruculosa]|uniref:Ankyrin repeat-containing domain protein n=1 Tax=Triangularia verruculosa TaxID=2587418 RepID=A0AAN6XJQ1_9PEZI|nr:ankyrin repeat-containing domain protein [Triangularia verruculosa]